MKGLLCRNRVADYAHWRQIFDSHLDKQTDAGLELVNVWQDLDDPKNVFFFFRVTDLDAARAFLEDPSGEEIGRASGVLDGECHFVVQAAPSDPPTG
jgi:hypothetical protein